MDNFTVGVLMYIDRPISFNVSREAPMRGSVSVLYFLSLANCRTYLSRRLSLFQYTSFRHRSDICQTVKET